MGELARGLPRLDAVRKPRRYPGVMCCFSRPIKHVSSTAIFARMASPGRQLLAYKMELAASSDLAMILPLPVPPGSPEDAVRFLDLSAYPTFFADLDRAFPATFELSLGGSFAPQPAARGAPLVVHDVGDFVASFVPTLGDFSRLDPRFRLDDAVWRKLPRYADHGFAVFQLRGLQGGWLSRLLRPERKKTFHPMAFEFPTRFPSHLFYPTVHIHDGEVHPEAFFDHALYAQADVAALAGCTTEPDGRDDLPWVAGEPAHRHLRVEATRGLVSAEGRLFKRTIQGPGPNADRWVCLPP
jgi:hypothetical protein